MNLLNALFKVSSLTLLSRVFGFVRDAVVASVFGAGMVTDAFFTAFRIPNLLRRQFGEGAFSQAFVPIFAEYHSQRSVEETRTLLNHVTGLLCVVLFVITLAGILAAPLVVYLTAPGFANDPVKYALTVDLLRVTFPYILFISLAALCGGILNTFNRFAVPAFTPVLLNISLIGFALAAAWFQPPIMALAWGAFFGGMLQLGFHLPFLKRIGFLPQIRPAWHDPGVRRVLLTMGPALIGVSVGQISLLLNTAIASFMGEGRVSWLYYADRLMELPAGVLGAALGTILLPSLSKRHAEGNRGEYSQMLDWGLRLTILLTVPAAVALAVLGQPLVATLFHRGHFLWQDVLMTEQALIAYAVGLVALIAVKVLAPGFYARQNVRTPVKIAIFSLLVTQGCNLVFYLTTSLQHVGLALSVSIGALCNAGFLLWRMLRENIYQPQSGWLTFGLKIALATIAMATLVYALQGPASFWQHAGTAHRAGRLALLCLGGAGCYFAMLWLMGIKPKDFMRRVR